MSVTDSPSILFNLKSRTPVIDQYDGNNVFSGWKPTPTEVSGYDKDGTLEQISSALPRLLYTMDGSQ